MTAAELAVSEEYELFSRYKSTKDKKLRDEIVSSYIYIAEILARRFVNRGIEYDDIYQVGCMGILYAVERFDPDKGVKFATYATATVAGEIRRYFRDKGSFIKVPRRLYEIFCRAEKLRRERENIDGDDISELLGISDEMLEKAYKAGKSSIESLENEIHSGADMAVSNTVGYEDDNFMVIEDCDFVDYCMSRLDEKERTFVRLRYYEEKSQREIGDIMNISQMKVSRMERGVLEKIKNMYFRD